MQVGEVDFGVQLHQILLWVSLIVDFQDLESNVKEVSVFADTTGEHFSSQERLFLQDASGFPVFFLLVTCYLEKT